MSEKTDQKLESVVLAQYHYRHEAEFAAGFLDDAGIPYRLQVDDAGVGLTISTPATIWVRGMDLNEASEILDIPDRRQAYAPVASGRVAEALPGPPIVEHAVETSDDGTRHDDPDDEIRPGVETPARRDGVSENRVRDGILIRDGIPVRDANVHRLTGFERLLAGVLLVGDLGVMGLTPKLEYGAVWVGVLAAVGAPLAAAVLAGRTFPPVRALLKAISGSVP